MNKTEKEYIEKYGNIPKDHDNRLSYLLSTLKCGKVKESFCNTIDNINSIKWKKLSYIIYLIPKGTPRPRAGKFGVFYVKGAKDNKKLFRQFIDSQKDIQLITTAVKLECVSYLPIPNSMNWVEKVLSEMGLIRPITIPDFDNLVKTYTDMMKDSLLYDDSLIIEGTSKKYYSVNKNKRILDNINQPVDDRIFNNFSPYSRDRRKNHDSGTKFFFPNIYNYGQIY